MFKLGGRGEGVRGGDGVGFGGGDEVEALLAGVGAGVEDGLEEGGGDEGGGWHCLWVACSVH